MLDCCEHPIFALNQHLKSFDMTTVLNINIDDLDTKFVENLKRDFAHAAV
jgi:hypothetical protein